jgi:non-ribosomal peptide synthase protein (TIGR01720 family)
VEEGEREAAWERESGRLQASLGLREGRLLRAGWFELGGGERRLLLIVHHLAVDGVSWRIVLEDLQRLCRGEEWGGRSSSYRAWAEQLQEQAESQGVRGELEYWAGVAERVRGVPRDYSAGENTVATAASVGQELSVSETRALLQEPARAYRVGVQEVVMTALARVLGHWSGETRVTMALEGHGREELGGKLDVSRTVGWFTALYPVSVEVGGPAGANLKRVKEQLRSVPGKGLGYGLLKYLQSAGRQRLSAAAEPEVVFNYLGQFDALLSGGGWSAARETTGPTRSPAGRRSHVLEINAHIAGGRLRLHWQYSRALHRPETVARLAAECTQQIRELIEDCRRSERQYTPSDFPLAELTQERLDAINFARERKRSRQESSALTADRPVYSLGEQIT